MTPGAFPQPALARGGQERRAELRSRPHLVADLLADAGTKVVALSGGRVPVDRSRAGAAPALALRPPRESDLSRLAIYLGELAGLPHVLVVVPPEEAESEAHPDTGLELAGLRSLGARLPGEEAGLLATAVALANWHSTHTHCPRCGTPTVPDLAGWIRRCPADDSEHYPRTDPAVIMSVVDDDDRLLLARGAGFTGTGMSVLAGFVEPGETMAGAVVREVREEVGIEVTDVTYLGDQPWPFPCSLMLGFRSRALGTALTLQDDEIVTARWFTRDELVSEILAERVHIPPRLSIARSIVEEWFGGPIQAPERSVRPE